ncbi:dihydrolipoamide acetyltransferase family protein [Halomonas beimenensis]|uniref:Dihydrolipoamide acetyltransferase component of pyruvate dehydrogenase complex n=1 Tax=Halomonas beimenensis TaxID=475662 RepID=A0A291P3X8_9GAMM|nr:dihydrolipoamide acetyltransferase family protein [Halomonas beimenensis]ATJ81568.1 pyruvate dehydrogenase E2 component (dihydrolipoamide acetyltransferase) [Halomonas beimenensis]
MSDFLMPSLGADMEAGTLAEWRVAPGDRVEKGQIIAVVETAKGAIDVEVFESGVVEECYVGPNTRVPVGTPLARIGGGERVVHDRPEPGAVDEPATVPEAETEAPSPGPRPPSPAGGGPSPGASPAARRRARELGLYLERVAGSGPGGAVVLRDLEGAGGEVSSAPGRPGGGGEPTEMRRAIAAAMTRSKREIPHYYLATTLDLQAAEGWLEAYNRDQPPVSRLLMAALFMKATARALVSYPDLNGHYEAQGFRPAERVDLGMAIHLRAGGLIAPAICGAEALALPELMARLQDLVQRTRSGGLRASEVGTATATVTALGERGVDTVYGVIQPPQVAMIGFGRVRRRPLAVDDMLAIRPAVDLSQAADHRVCDGHLGARFLNEIDAQLQHPEAL